MLETWRGVARSAMTMTSRVVDSFSHSGVENYPRVAVSWVVRWYCAAICLDRRGLWRVFDIAVRMLGPMRCVGAVGGNHRAGVVGQELLRNKLAFWVVGVPAGEAGG